MEVVGGRSTCAPNAEAWDASRACTVFLSADSTASRGATCDWAGAATTSNLSSAAAGT